jgi:hypothetical protein
MRYLVVAVIAMAMAPMTALAEGGVGRGYSMDGDSKNPTQLYFEKQEKERADNEKAYNAQMKRLKGQNPTDIKRDPWSTVRPSDSTAKR